MDLKELKRLLTLLKKEGIQTFENEGIKLAFHPDVFHAETQIQTPGSNEIKSDPQFTDMDTLFWSSPGIPTSEEEVEETH